MDDGFLDDTDDHTAIAVVITLMIHCLHIVHLPLQVLSSMEKQFGIKSEEAAWIFSGKKLENLHSPPGPASCKSVQAVKPLEESDEKERFCYESSWRPF